MPKRTPLYDRHVALGAKMTQFAGWEMPVRYAGIIKEHDAVRQRAGLFDICHMGQIEVRGEHATAVVQRVSTNDVSRLPVGKAQYSVMCREDGGIVDDILTYRLAEDRLMLVVNAANREKDYEWIKQVAAGLRAEGRYGPQAGEAEVADISDQTALLALQGPAAERVLQRLTNDDLSAIGRYWAAEVKLLGALQALASRTGYAGEDGFEVYCSPADVGALWDAILDAGKDDGVVPCGLGARDVLRLEAGLCLYGQDISEETNPLEAGLEWIVKCDSKPDFVGREALCRIKAQGTPQRLVGLHMEGSRIPRHGCMVLAEGERIGLVTSGTYSPSLDCPIALAYVRMPYAREGSVVEVSIGPRHEREPGRVVSKRLLDELNKH